LSEVNENFMECRCDSKIYSCTAEGILILEIENDIEASGLTQAFSVHDPIGANYTRRVSPSSLAEAVITYTNSSHVRSTLKVSGINTLLGYHVACAGERIEIFTGDRDISKQYLQNRLL